MATKNKTHLFKTVAKASGSNDKALVSDGQGTEIELQKAQSFSFNQRAVWSKLVKETEDLSTFERQIRLAAGMMKLEFNTPNLSDTDVLSPEGQAVSEAMVEAIYNHYADISSRHAPEVQLLYVSGPDAEKVAIEYAKKEKAVVATTPALELLNQYYVLRSTSAVTDLNISWMMQAGSEAQQYKVIHSSEEILETTDVKDEAPVEGESTGTDTFSPF